MKSQLKTRILVEIAHDQPLNWRLPNALARRLERNAVDYIRGMGSDCRSASAHVVKEAAIAMQQTESADATAK